MGPQESWIIPLVEVAGTARREEATEVLRISRVSWRLRDDDNLLLSRVESQLLRAVDLGLDRPRGAGRLRGKPRRNQEAIPAIVAALRDDSHIPLDFPAGHPEDSQFRSSIWNWRERSIDFESKAMSRESNHPVCHLFAALSGLPCNWLRFRT